MSPPFIDHDSAYNHVELPPLAIGTFILISWQLFIIFLPTLKPEKRILHISKKYRTQVYG